MPPALPALQSPGVHGAPGVHGEAAGAAAALVGRRDQEAIRTGKGWGGF